MGEAQKQTAILDISPLTGVLGCEIHGVNLSDLYADTFATQRLDALMQVARGRRHKQGLDLYIQ
ncbi:MAG: hypothetical protein QF790_11515 [Gammaproteobacteria bacterium]|jgi:hypothetical protein|nr:hypothetical protein [Gammaproteobacteria bacterium]MDP6617785.1 hypothetical protein [Gammaproteobacteria bacterium]MDP6694171.1 hypothetical protein [Gammaproteobacteria bacterium]